MSLHPFCVVGMIARLMLAAFAWNCRPQHVQQDPNTPSVINVGQDGASTGCVAHDLSGRPQSACTRTLQCWWTAWLICSLTSDNCRTSLDRSTSRVLVLRSHDPVWTSWLRSEYCSPLSAVRWWLAQKVFSIGVVWHSSVDGLRGWYVHSQATTAAHHSTAARRESWCSGPTTQSGRADWEASTVVRYQQWDGDLRRRCSQSVLSVPDEYVAQHQLL